MMRWLTKLYAWACERLYAEFAWSYDWVSWLVSGGQWAQWRRLALAYLPATPAARVLELGFGTGELLSAMARQGFTVYGLELSPAMHRITAAKLQRRGLAVSCVRAQAQAMPWAEGSFSTIIATFPAPYILDPTTLRECARLLRKPQAEAHHAGGQLLIVGLWVALSGPAWLTRVPLFYGAPSPAFLSHIQERLAAAGFAVTLTEQQVGRARVGIVIGQC